MRAKKILCSVLTGLTMLISACVSKETVESTMPTPETAAETVEIKPGLFVPKYPGSVQDPRVCPGYKESPPGYLVAGQSMATVSKDYCELLLRKGWKLSGGSCKAITVPSASVYFERGTDFLRVLFVSKKEGTCYYPISE